MHDPISSLRQLLSQSPSDALWRRLVDQIASIPEEQSPLWLANWLLEHLSSWPSKFRGLKTPLLEEVSPDPLTCQQKLQPLLPSISSLELKASPEWRFWLTFDCWDSLQRLEWFGDETPEATLQLLTTAPCLPYLQTLGWRHNRMTIDNLYLLLSVLDRMKALEVLDLQNNELEDIGVEILTQQAELPSLKTLSLNYNELTNDFYDFTVEPLFRTPRWKRVKVVLEEMMYAGMGRSGPLHKVLNRTKPSLT